MSLYDILDLIWYAFAAFSLLPIGIGLRRWQNLTSQNRWLVRFCVAFFLLDVASTLLRFNAIRNHFMYYFTTLVLLWIGAAIYTPTLGWKQWPTRIASLSSIAMFVEIVAVVGFNHINTVTFGLSWLLLAIYAFRRLNQLLDRPVTSSLRQSGEFYVHVGFLAAGSIVGGIKFLENYFIETSLDLYYFSDTLAIMTLAFTYVCFSVELLQQRQS